MSFVLVVDQERRPQGPVHPGHARWLLSHGQAAVLHRAPFTLILKRVSLEARPEPLRLKLDPGSTTTGLAVVHDGTGQVVWAAELAHRGEEVKHALEQRRGVRRSRRQRHTRYRQPRFRNRRRKPGWQPPSRQSRVQNAVTWVERLRRWCPIGALALELVRFDTQRLQPPEIAGVAYQQGDLAGYELRQYLLEKWNRRCAYCGASNVPLQIEHILPRSRGGTDRASNLTLACEPCNTAKGTRTAAEFGHAEVEAQAKQPLKDAAAVNATRWLLFERLQGLGLPLETGTGGRTQWNRTRRRMPKTHWVDARCVGRSTPEVLHWQPVVPWQIEAEGRQSRQLCQVDTRGFIRSKPKERSRVRGFRTGDLVRASCPAPLKTVGVHVGRVLVRASGSFDVATPTRRVEGISWWRCQRLQQGDGYTCHQERRALPPRAEVQGLRARNR
jgi:5-methylcytosine-specific restriction endonuclease McrA